MSDPAKGMFPDTLVEPFVESPEVAELADQVLADFDEFAPIQEAIRDGLRIRYVFETKPFDPARDELKHDAIAKVRKAGEIWRTLADCELVIQFRQWFWERFDDQARRRTLHHEFSHVEVDEADERGRVKLSLRHHEVEDFAGTLRVFGPRPWHSEFFKAYLDWSHAQEHPEPTPLQVVQAIADRVAKLPVEDQVVVHDAVDALKGLQDVADQSGMDITIKAAGVERTLRGRRPATEPPADVRALYGNLVRQGEALEQAAHRLGDDTTAAGSPEGQRLLEVVNQGGGAEVPWPSGDEE